MTTAVAREAEEEEEEEEEEEAYKVEGGNRRHENKLGDMKEPFLRKICSACEGPIHAERWSTRTQTGQGTGRLFQQTVFRQT